MRDKKIESEKKLKISLENTEQSKNGIKLY